MNTISIPNTKKKIFNWLFLYLHTSCLNESPIWLRTNNCGLKCPACGSYFKSFFGSFAYHDASKNISLVYRSLSVSISPTRKKIQRTRTSIGKCFSFEFISDGIIGVIFDIYVEPVFSSDDLFIESSCGFVFDIETGPFGQRAFKWPRLVWIVGVLTPNCSKYGDDVDKCGVVRENIPWSDWEEPAKRWSVIRSGPSGIILRRGWELAW